MSNLGPSVWRVTPQTITAQLYTPGVDNIRVEQKARDIYVSGSNDNYGVRYHYILPLHTDARDNVRHSYHQGLVEITCDNVTSVNTVLSTVNTAGVACKTACPQSL